jgi:hypothetical protein
MFVTEEACFGLSRRMYRWTVVVKEVVEMLSFGQRDCRHLDLLISD